ncbi:hypothetical protein [Variovorax sp. EBFNA2]|uniref:hypothetical protein n=1 Tax=Variovorax sp. EBFNA2 TaxID=3342097 RepID=UPI0029C05CA5|nr:hypothetical protein [Variovorax boronicumulans]WPG39678.1 hypothetical protein RZE79_10155 [Variovorax boronicumulans]
MTVSLAASLIDLALGLKLSAADKAASNRFSLEGASCQPGPDGGLEIRIQRIEATALLLASGPFVLEIGRIVVHDLVAQIQTDGGAPRLDAMQAREVECAGLKLQGPLNMAPHVRKAGDASLTPDDAWRLDPLGQAEGTVRAQITDAHLLFDADVTVPIRHGQIDFNDATVEHVGPDSRMGISRLGLYVDAPNGRSYLYQFASAPLAGVEFEHRGALLGSWVSERGKLQLQAFAESTLRQGRENLDPGLTAQARLLMARTGLSGEVRLGDGLLAMPGMQVHLQGRAEGANAIALHSKSAGRGLTADIASLSARDAAASWKGAQLGCDALTGKLKVQLLVEGPPMRFVLELENARLTTPRFASPH